MLKRLVLGSLILALPVMGWTQSAAGVSDNPGSMTTGMPTGATGPANHVDGQGAHEAAGTLGRQSASTQSDSVRDSGQAPACSNGAPNWPTCTFTTTRIESQTSPCPAPQTGVIFEVRTVTTVNGVDVSTTEWQYSGDNCASRSTSPNPSPSPARAPTSAPTCTPSQSASCWGWDLVTVDNCTGGVISKIEGGCAPAPDPAQAPKPTATVPAMVMSQPGIDSGAGTWAYFVPGTKVALASQKEVPIEKVKVGDQVRTFDESTGLFTSSPVVKVFDHEEKDDYLVKMKLSNGRTLTSNVRHMIYANGRYQRAGDVAAQRFMGSRVMLTGRGLKEGDAATSVEVMEVTIRRGVSRLLTLHVASPYDREGKESSIGHNFVAEGVVVHNKRGGQELVDSCPKEISTTTFDGC